MPKKKKYVVVENAGYAGERDVRSFGSVGDALSWMIKDYAADERHDLHVAIAVDSPDGSRSFEA